MDVLCVPTKMVLVLPGLPPFLFAMREYTLSWIRHHQGQVTQVETAFTQSACWVQIWPVLRRAVTFPGKSAHVLKQVLAKHLGGIAAAELQKLLPSHESLIGPVVRNV